MRFISCLAAAAVAIVACAAHADTITIDPNNFAAGQDISFSTPGVQMYTLLAVPNQDPNASPDSYVPSLMPVYADAVPSNCLAYGRCAPVGNMVFGHLTSASSPNVGGELTWDEDTGSTCFFTLEGCAAVAAHGPSLLLIFDSPVRTVSILGTAEGDNSAAVSAFDGGGNIIGSCFTYGLVLPGNNGGGCAQAYSQGWGWFTVSSATTSISYALIGGADFASISQITFGTAPEPATFGLMTLGLLGLAWSQRRRLRRAS